MNSKFWKGWQQHQIYCGVCLSVAFTTVLSFPAIAQTPAIAPALQLDSPTSSIPNKIDLCLQPRPQSFSPEQGVKTDKRSVELDSPIGRVQIQGYTVLSSDEVKREAQQVIDSKTDSSQEQFSNLEKLGERIGDRLNLLYINKGYITSQFAFETPPVQNGVVRLIAIEGYVSTIEVEGRQRLNLAYICDRIQLGISPPLKKERLEEQLRLLKTDPLFRNIEASLRAGKSQGERTLGESILNVRIAESKALNVSLGADNFSPPSVGSERLGGSISYRNPTGIGDGISTTYYNSTTGGSRSLDINYRAPINPINGTIQLRFAPSFSKITDPEFKDLGIQARNRQFDITYRQPLVRSVSQEFALALGFSAQDGQTFLFNDTPFPFGIGPDEQGNSRTRALQFAQDYIKRDLTGAWGLRSQFSFGLGIWGATKNSDPTPDGQFFSWLGQVQRVQKINDGHLLIIQADAQLSPSSLLPSQQFVIGGGQSVRGYRQNARSGDSGFRVSIENRIAALRDKNGLPILQLAPFFDAGSVWNKSDNPNPLPDQTFLAGLGLGVIYEPLPGFVIRLDYGRFLNKLRDKGNNAQDEGFYFSVGLTL